ncbi:hypothetical protein HY546_00545 [archaeon]|nr:hypothetical protein [archaeon]
MLLIVVASAAIVRFSPVIAYDKPLKFDSYFHARIVPLYDPLPPTTIPWPEGGRPNFYPPVYHYMLAAASLMFENVLEATRFLLPFFAVLTVPLVFLMVRRFKGDTAALMAAYLIAIAPHSLATSYDSPQVIGLFLAIPAFYFFSRGALLKTSAVLAFIFLLDPFPAIMFSLTAVLVLFWTRKDAASAAKNAARLISLPALSMLAWFGTRTNAFSCMENSVGTYFLGLLAPRWLDPQAPLLFVLLLIVVYFAFRARHHLDLYDKFWLAWSLIGAALFFSYPITVYFHPWRHDTLMLFGLYLLAPALLMKARLKPLFLFTYSALPVLASLMIILSASFTPPLPPNDYTAMDWLAKRPAPLLAHPDFCAGYQTLTGQACKLDIYLECIPDREKWFALENVYYADSRQPVIDALNRYGITHLVYPDSLPPYIEGAGFDKLYSSWSFQIYSPQGVYVR